MLTQKQITKTLLEKGYQITGETTGYTRLKCSSCSGSLYVKVNYLSATGALKALEETVQRSSSDSKNNPEWRNEDLKCLLASLKNLSYQAREDDAASFNAASSPREATTRFSLHEQDNPIHWTSTGIYIAYPTSPVLKPIYRNYKTMVNDRHTKVGIAQDSFTARKSSYLKTFDGEVEFICVASRPKSELKKMEDTILSRLCSKYLRVGHAREWFETTERDNVIALVLEALDPVIKT